jgi:hypothetical protein
MMSRVRGSIKIGSRGLSRAMPFMADTKTSASVLPPAFFRTA